MVIKPTSKTGDLLSFYRLTHRHKSAGSLRVHQGFWCTEKTKPCVFQKQPPCMMTFNRGFGQRRHCKDIEKHNINVFYCVSFKYKVTSSKKPESWRSCCWKSARLYNSLVVSVCRNIYPRLLRMDPVYHQHFWNSSVSFAHGRLRHVFGT